MLRALPKSQQARWLEIGRAFERVRRTARPGEHVAFTPVAEAGGSRMVPTRFAARTARIPSGLRPNFAEAATSPPEAREAPSDAEEAPAPPPAAAADEVAARAEPEVLSASGGPVAAGTTETPPPPADATPVPEPADPFSEGFLRRRRPASGAEWGGWTSYAAGKDLAPGDEATAGAHADAAPAEAPPAPATSLAMPPASVVDSTVPPPAPAPAPERRGEGEEPRVSAIEYFRAAPW